MEKLDFNGKLNFNDKDLTEPNIVVEEIASQIKSATNGIIIGAIKNYFKPIESYTETTFSGLSSIIPTEKKVDFDVQTTLGKIGEIPCRYEFYLCTPSFTQYKYRICFFQHGIANYPVKVVLEQSVAYSINSNSSYVFICNNRKELEELIIKVIYSKRIISVMQELISINQIHKKEINTMDASEQTDNKNTYNDDTTE